MAGVAAAFAAGSRGAAAENVGHVAEISASGAQLADAAWSFAGSVARGAGEVAWMLIPFGVMFGAYWCYCCWGSGVFGAPYGYAEAPGQSDGTSAGDNSSSAAEEDERWFQQRDAAVARSRSPSTEPDPEGEYHPSDSELAEWAAARWSEENQGMSPHGYFHDEWESLQRYAADPSPAANT